MTALLEPAAPFQLSETARIGAVELIVSDLSRSLDFYAGVIGLNVLAQGGSSAQLGVAAEGRVLLELRAYSKSGKLGP
ncbi:VOC family protein [Deinococcus sp.]|uniref:VOC family protein n=1 Tax=Deinococcus sp. TaxID=47478 RepID=UPI0025D3DEDD|nr:VOC family protein [Deinococcus sp.]